MEDIIITVLVITAAFALVTGLLVKSHSVLQPRPSFSAGGIAAVLALAFTAGCGPIGNMSPQSKSTLEGIIARVDVGRLIQCGGSGDAKAVAKCLGARVLTEGLEEAIHQATRLAEDAQQASNPAAGAADMDPSQKAVLANDLELALDNLGEEIAQANKL